jgi:hypothetical protein
MSYAAQTGHYFARPHERVPVAPIGGPAAWRGEALKDRSDWRFQFTEAHIREIEAALAIARATGKPLGELTAVDFPLPQLAAEIAAWRSALVHGRGFQLVSGLPVERWPAADTECVYWCLGQHLGRPGAQNPQGDLLGHVRDDGSDAEDPFVRLYRTRADIAYHCDAADVVALLCLRSAERGGASRIVSSVTVFDTLLAEAPELASRLFEPFRLDVRNEDKSGALHHIPVPPCRHAGGALRTFYHSDYFRSAQRHADVPAFSQEEQRLLDLYEAIALRPALRLDMDLAAGDIQWLSNHTILHARTGYTDFAEPSRRRELVRLWLSVTDDPVSDVSITVDS